MSVNTTAVTGDIQYDHNSGPLEAHSNRVNGSIQVVGNRGSNSMQGNKEDQCARL